MNPITCFLCEIATIFPTTESFCEYKTRKICSICIEKLSTTLLPISNKKLQVQVDIQEHATIEIGKWDKCEFHEHKQRLLCQNCNTLICVLCVPLHNTHSFSSIEDLIVEMVPRLHEIEYLSRYAFQESKEQNTEIETILNNTLQFFSKVQGQSSSSIYLKCEKKISKYSSRLKDLVYNFKGKNLSKFVAQLKNPGKEIERESVLHWIHWNTNFLTVFDRSYNKKRVELNDYKIPHFSRSVLIPNGIVVCGGRTDPDSKGLQKATLIKLPGFEVQELPNMHYGRANHCLLYHEGMVYVIGGCDHDNKYSNRVERYNIELNCWEILASTNKTRDSSSAVVRENEKSIYLFGGRFGGSSITNSIEKYLISSNFWVSLDWKITFPSMVLGSVKISENEVLVFAGQNEVAQPVKKCNIINLNSGAVREISDFQSGGCIVNEPIFAGGSVACLVFDGSAARKLCFWNKETETWDDDVQN